jgi:hypothetical protein
MDAAFVVIGVSGINSAMEKTFRRAVQTDQRITYTTVVPDGTADLAAGFWH